MDAPYFAEFINSEEVKAADPVLQRVRLSNFFKRYLLQKAMSVFKWQLPTTWRREYFLFCLYGRGYVAVFNTDKFGPIPQECGLYGNDVFYGPTHAVIANPLLKGDLRPKIDVQCVLLKLQPDYGGIMDLVNFYGNKLLLSSESLDMNLLNSKFSYVFAAGNNAKATAFNKLYDRIQEGKPASVIDRSLFNSDGTPAWQAFEQNVGQNYIAEELLSTMRTLENMFDTVVGIPNANTDKRERMITDEANANNVETECLASTWLENLKEGCKKANAMFNISMSVNWRFPPQQTQPKGGAAGERNVVNSRTV